MRYTYNTQLFPIPYFIATNTCILAISRLFTDTKVAAEDPLKAAGVYENIVDAIQEADNATDAASQAAVTAFGKIVDSRNGPMDDQVRDSLGASKDLHDDSLVLEDKSSGKKSGNCTLTICFNGYV